MKTKHLFFATALVASFASCTNDDIAEIQQGVANVERPTVEDVRLNFVAEGVDSRLTFGSEGYAWEADDVIGALNMDAPGSKEKNAKWTAKYDLKDYINTSYPFTYDAEAGTWGTPGKMLEGNYFFAFPFTDYEGERYAKYSLTEQQQNGIKGAVVAENYAKNQVFVGYSPILKGTEFDVLTDIEMTSLLGAVQLRIKNEGTKTYHINKVVIEGSKVNSEFVLNPVTNITNSYNSYTVGDSETPVREFYPANYLGKDFGGDKVAASVLTDIEEEKFAEKRMAALRDVADFGGDKKFAQLFVNGTEEERALAVKGTAYALVMVSPYQYYKTDDDGDFTENKVDALTSDDYLRAKIYTDEGVITVEDLLAIEADDMSGYVRSTEPGVANTIVVSFKDSDVDELNKLDVYSTEDLIQLISWNKAAAKKTPIYATLCEDVELNKEVLDLLKSNDKLTLKIMNADSKTYALTLAADLAADALSYEGLSILDKNDQTINSKTCDAVAVKIAGEINLVKESIKLASIEVLDGAVLNINVLNATVPAVVTVNEGATLNIGAAAKTSNTVEITNNGIVNVAAGALVQGPINNKAELNLNGTANNVANEGIVNLGATSKLMGGTNTTENNKDAVINMVSGATLANINPLKTDYTTGRVKYVDGAIITHTGTGTAKTSTVKSKVFVEVGNATVSADTYKDKGVKLWTLTGDINVTHSVTLGEVEVKKETTVVVTVAADSLLTISTLNVLKDAAISTNGKIKVTNLNVAEDGEWTNNGEAVIATALKNEGTVYNNGVAKHDGTATTLTGVYYKVEAGTRLPEADLTKGAWENNLFEEFYTPSRTDKQQAMDNAVAKWADEWKTRLDNSSDLYQGNPYDYIAFVNAYNRSGLMGDEVKKALLVKVVGNVDSEENGETDDITLFSADVFNLSKLAAGTASEPSEFAEAVKFVLGEDEEEAATAALVNPSTHATAPGQFTTDAVGYLTQKQIIIFENETAVSHFVASLVNTKTAVNDGDLFDGNAKNAAAAWDLTLTTAINTTSTTKWNYIAEGDSIYEAARIWALHSGRITNIPETAKYFISDANKVKNTVAQLKGYVDYLSNIKSSDKTDAQTDAYTAISPYKEFIFKLVEDGCEYTSNQINACVAHDEDAARIEYGFEIDD